jgi:hypothetical protein
MSADQDKGYTDKNLVCIDCKQPFVFSAGEQEYFVQKGYSERRRCKPCADKKKAAREAGGR